MWGVHECERCALRRRVEAIIVHDGRTDAPLEPLVDLLCARPNPASIDAWVHTPATRSLLERLARGGLALTHTTFADLKPTRTGDRLQGLLMDAGLLPARDRDLLRFEQWSNRLVAAVTSPDDRLVLARYVAWHHQRRLSAAGRRGDLKTSSTTVARQQVRAALMFLTWLRRRGVVLSALSQGDLDRWFATGKSSHNHARRFISWAADHRLAPRLRLPRHRQEAPDRLPRDEHLALINLLLTDDTIETRDRIAGLLVLLYAQPVSRISRLPRNAVAIRASGCHMRLAGEAVPLPGPLSPLITSYLDHQPNEARPSPWLFPGQEPGQPITAKQLRSRLRSLGIGRLGRVAAFDQLAGEVPAPVLADLTGYNPKVAADRAATNWSTYAANRAAPPGR